MDDVVTLVEPQHETSQTCWVEMANFQTNMSEKNMETKESPLKQAKKQPEIVKGCKTSDGNQICTS